MSSMDSTQTPLLLDTNLSSAENSSGFLTGLFGKWSLFGSSTVMAVETKVEESLPQGGMEKDMEKEIEKDFKIANMKSVIDEIKRKHTSSSSSSLASSSSSSSSSSTIQPIKVVLLGDGNVGKTTLVKRHKTGEFEVKSIPTVTGCEVTNLTFNTNVGKVTLNIWDCAGLSQNVGLGEGYWIGAKAGIIMFDLTSEDSFNSVKNWKEKLSIILTNEPVIICGNKNDCKHARKDLSIKAKNIGQYYYEVSAKSNYNFEKPFLQIIRRVLGDDTIYFTEGAPVSPPVAVFNQNNFEHPLDLDQDEDEDDDDDLTEGYGSLYEENILALDKLSESPYLSNLDHGLIKNIRQKHIMMCKIHYNQPI
jgi:GTP-binding nuclear protein Ran